MDSLDLANYRLLVPQRWKKRIGTAVLLFALLFPDQFRDAFIAQVERHAQHVTTEFLKVMLPRHHRASTNADARANATTEAHRAEELGHPAWP